MNIELLVKEIKSIPGCAVNPPCGEPKVAPFRLPEDLRQFYDVCGGVVLYAGSGYAVTIVPPEQVKQANLIIVGDDCEDDLSSSWYIIAKDANSEYLSIDLAQNRLGRCYDSFYEGHAVPGSCPIIATSFSDLLSRLFENKGQHWYWLRPEFESVGDAYD